MTDQPALPWDDPAPYQAHSATSRAAASWADASGLSLTARGRVLRLLMDTRAALTDEEMQDELGMNASTQRPRRVELTRAGLVVPDGEARTRAGRRAVCWRVADQ